MGFSLQFLSLGLPVWCLAPAQIVEAQHENLRGADFMSWDKYLWGKSYCINNRRIYTYIIWLWSAVRLTRVLYRTVVTWSVPRPSRIMTVLRLFHVEKLVLLSTYIFRFYQSCDRKTRKFCPRERLESWLQDSSWVYKNESSLEKYAWIHESFFLRIEERRLKMPNRFEAFAVCGLQRMQPPNFRDKVRLLLRLTSSRFKIKDLTGQNGACLSNNKWVQYRCSYCWV